MILGFVGETWTRLVNGEDELDSISVNRSSDFMNVVIIIKSIGKVYVRLLANGNGSDRKNDSGGTPN